jgi:dynein intermediate chain 1
VFDLAENKHEPLSQQKIVRGAKLTRVCFNQVDPILVVGDDKGGVTSLKLSPNLRRVTEQRDTDGDVAAHDAVQMQIERMERVLQSADPRPSA